mmetsp:Transcript_16738/g.27135  ORF Transcript_16738/g.27135 Transcript_16738/m.27135 type:complete len:254 (+) Transcript_16738:75-836(+)
MVQGDANDGKHQEYECVIFGVVGSGRDLDVVSKRVHSLCNDGCLHAPNVHVETVVYASKNPSSLLSTSGGGTQEVHIRKVIGDQIGVGHKVRTCAAGVIPRLDGQGQQCRYELIRYGLFQKTALKKFDTPVRSLLRVSLAGDIDPFVAQNGFVKKYETFHQGERLLTRDGIEIEIFQVKKRGADGTDQYIVSKNAADVAGGSPYLVTIKYVAGTESEIEKCAKRLRAFANDVFAGSVFEEVKAEQFVPRNQIR